MIFSFLMTYVMAVYIGYLIFCLAYLAGFIGLCLLMGHLLAAGISYMFNAHIWRAMSYQSYIPPNHSTEAVRGESLDGSCFAIPCFPKDRF